MLSDLARLESGHTPSRRHPEYWGGVVPWVSIRDAKAHHGSWIEHTDETINDLGLANSSARLIPAGAVCLSRTASVGYVVIAAKPVATSQDFVNWICGSQLEPRFLQYLFLAEGESILRFASGAIHQTIYFPEAKAFSVCVPSIDEQRRIVAILDEAFEGIATVKENAEKNLRNARELFDGYLSNVFSGNGDGWSVNSLGDIADCCLGKMLDKVKNKGDLKPYLRNLNVRWFYFDMTDMQEMRFTPDEYERYSVRRGDVVICEGGYPGRAAIWENDEPVFIQKALHRVRFPNAVMGRWFLYYLYLQETAGALRQHFTGSGIQHFTGAALSRLILPLAPANAMAAMVDRFDAMADEVRRLEAIYREKALLLEDLKKSLLHQAFTGQL
jgi:type I restriction enzyme, S subunit